MVADILDAIRGLPRSEKVRLVEQLNAELEGDACPQPEEQVPSDPRLELRNGFYVLTGPVDVDAVDHRAYRDERADQIAGLAGARRN